MAAEHLLLSSMVAIEDGSSGLDNSPNLIAHNVVLLRDMGFAEHLVVLLPAAGG